MNWLDILLFAIVIFFALVGWQRGLVRQIFDVVGVVASYFVAIRYGNDFILWFTRYAPLTEWFPQLFNNPTPLGFDLGDVIIRLIGFALLFGIVSLLFRITGNIAHSVFSLPVLDIVNGFGGLLLGAIKGILLGFIMIG
ncbi:MAG: CvpA family protein, partial [Firmicutes bacterium]|nr:CvpA family protein [Bacillota bacterium]